jgi:hypothetical protein
MHLHFCGKILDKNRILNGGFGFLGGVAGEKQESSCTADDQNDKYDKQNIKEIQLE